MLVEVSAKCCGGAGYGASEFVVWAGSRGVYKSIGVYLANYISYLRNCKIYFKIYVIFKISFQEKQNDFGSVRLK